LSPVISSLKTNVHFESKFWEEEFESSKVMLIGAQVSVIFSIFAGY